VLLIAGGAGILASVVQMGLPPLHRIATAAAIFGVYGMAYLGGALLAKVPEAQAVMARLGRAFKVFQG
jgi:hypothetical protein